MTDWFGKIEIGKISTVRVDSTDQPGVKESLTEMKDNSVKFVHYPDCQQLIIWLPNAEREYNQVRLKDKSTNKVVEEWPVTDRLNGSIQILWDTLTVAPGDYRIEIDWKNGWQHQVEFIKREEGFIEKKKEPAPLPKHDETVHAPIIYHDGFGKIIENEDLQLQEKLKKEIIDKFTRHIEYEGTFRAGTIIYVDGETRIEFSHEMGGGNCMFYIDIPTEKQWEAQTKTPLSQRKEILEFVAKTVNRQQASNCRFEMEDNTITYYYR